MISIIIPYYKAQRFFIETLLSVYSQEGVNKEVIVVNDGSGEQDVAFLIAQQNQFGFILLHQENKGVSAARNAGIKIAKGNFIFFLDADDTLYPHALEKLLALNTDVAVGDFSMNGTIITRELLGKQFVQGNPIAMGSTLIKAQLVKIIGGFDQQLAYSEDIDFWFVLWRNGAKFELLYDLVLHYRRHENSAMGVSNSKKLSDNLTSFAKRYSIAKQEDLLSKKQLKEIFYLRSKTNHWYARELGGLFILRHYAFLISINPIFALNLIGKFVLNDWRYIKNK